MAILDEAYLLDFSREVVPLISRAGVDTFDNAVKSPEQTLKDLTRTAEEVRLVPTHKAAAYRALAGFLEEGCFSNRIRDLCTKNETFYDVLIIYVRKSDGYSPKPALRLLSALLKILSFQEGQAAHLNTVKAVNLCLSHVLNHEDPTGANPAIIALRSLLEKRFIRIRTFLECVETLVPSAAKKSSPKAEFDTAKSKAAYQFFKNVLQWATLVQMASAAGALLFKFVKIAQGSHDLAESIFRSAKLWLIPVRDVLKENPSVIDLFERSVLPKLYQLDTQHTLESIKPDLDRLRDGLIAELSETDIRVCLLSLKILKPPTTYQFTGHILGSCHLLVKDYMLKLLFHRNPQIRIMVLTFIESAYISPELIHRDVLTAIGNSLEGFHADTDPQTRSSFTGVMKRLLERMHNTVGRLQNAITQVEKDLTWNSRVRDNSELEAVLVRDREDLNEYNAFLAQYSQVVKSGLKVSAPYQHHVSCLRVVQDMVLTDYFSKWKKDLLLDLVPTFVRLVMDPFDDVRALAASVLSEILKCKALRELHNLTQIMVQKQMLGASVLLGRRQRADLADSVGRLCSIWSAICAEPGNFLFSCLDHLENCIRIAASSLDDAVTSAPMHGDLIAIRYILGKKDIGSIFADADPKQSWLSFHARLMKVFPEIWHAVKSVLCDDCPEGAEFRETEVSDDVGLQDILSCAWRSLKESSQLMQLMFSRASNEHYLLTEPLSFNDIRHLGDLCLLQLAELRHRGAFSTVAQTFAACCVFCTTSADQRIRALVDEWYRSLDCIKAKKTALTRRSAGLPSIITAILIGKTSDEFLQRAISDLTVIARAQVVYDVNLEKTDLPQIHALNCLKDIFTNTRLGPVTESYISEIAGIAAESLASDIWAIRNCGNMLLKALIDRVATRFRVIAATDFETHRTYANAMFDWFPQLSGLICRLLEQQKKDVIVGRTFEEGDGTQQLQREFAISALQILRKTGISPEYQENIKLLLLNHLQSPVWNIRAQAARCLSHIVGAEELLRRLEDAFHRSNSSNNLCHGILYCLREHLAYSPCQITDILKRLIDAGGKVPVGQLSPFVWTLYWKTVYRAAQRFFEDARMNSDDIKVVDEADFSSNQSSLDHNVDVLIGKLSHFEGLNNAQRDLSQILSTKRLLQNCRTRTNSVDDRKLHIELEIIGLNSRVQGDLRSMLSACFNLRDETDSTMLLNPSQQSDVTTYCMPGEYNAKILDKMTQFLMAKMELQSVGEFNELNATETSVVIKRFLCKQLKRLQSSVDSLEEEDVLRNAYLRFYGTCLAWIHRFGKDQHSYGELMLIYNRTLRLAVREQSDYEDRISAISSIWNFRYALGSEWNPAYFETWVSVETALVDDSGEIRDLAARLFSYALSEKSFPTIPQGFDKGTWSLEPVVAHRILVEVLTSMNVQPCITAEVNVLHEQYFLQVSFLILGNAPFRPNSKSNDSSNAFLPPALDLDVLFSKLNVQGYAMFEEERVNQYVDEVSRGRSICHRLVAAWGLQSLSINEDTAEDIMDWLASALHALISYLNENKASCLPLPFGRDVWVFGMRVFMYLAMFGHLLRTRPTRTTSAVGNLAMLHALGQTVELDQAWMTEIDACYLVWAKR